MEKSQYELQRRLKRKSDRYLNKLSGNFGICIRTFLLTVLGVPNKVKAFNSHDSCTHNLIYLNDPTYILCMYLLGNLLRLEFLQTNFFLAKKKNTDIYARII